MKIYFLTVLIFMGMVTNANGRWGGLPMCGALQTPFRSILVGNEDEKFSIYGCSSLVSDISCDPLVPEQNKNGNNKPSVLVNQLYQLHPNPNDGVVNLTQLITDTESVSIEILNDIGERVYKDKITFINNAAKLNISNKSPGLYLIKIIDCKGGIFNLKFVLAK